jgi:Helix-turn-helix domain
MRSYEYQRAVAASDLTRAQRLVAVTISSFADEHGECWPSHAAIAERAAYTARYQVGRTVRLLVARGWLEQASFVGRTNGYRLAGPTAAQGAQGEPGAQDLGSALPRSARGDLGSAVPRTWVVQYPPLGSAVPRNYPENETENQTKTPPSPPAPVPAVAAQADSEGGFAAFWQLAENRTGHGAARQAWRNATRGTLPSVILAAWSAANRAWETWPADRRRYIPAPARWLTEARWNDGPPQPAAPPPPSKLQRSINLIATIQAERHTAEVDGPPPNGTIDRSGNLAAILGGIANETALPRNGQHTRSIEP